MKRLIRIVKRLLIPGSMTFLALGLAVSLLLLHGNRTARAAGDAALLALAALYWFVSLPAVAQALIAGLQGRYRTLRTADEARGAAAIVIVGNGSVSYTDGRFTSDQLTRRSTFCVFEGARLYQLLHPDYVIASGGAPAIATGAAPESELIRDALIRLGLPGDRIVVDATSHTTEEQASNVGRLLQERDPRARAVVVTTAAHMPRVMKLFAAQHIDAIPSVTPDLKYDEGRTGWMRWWPSTAALRGSESAMYEYLALVLVAIGPARN
ncbi:MAG: YdcF family protein [Acidobacteria bacterium]|nr:YdcF family protein [Acidobacteriota bacterium]